MYKLTANGPNRVDLELSGKLDSADMRRLLDELVERTKDLSHGRMLYQIHDFSLPSVAAIGVELSRLPELFRLIRKIDRVAVLADREWIRKVSELEGALFPGVQIKAFAGDQEADAEAWLVE